MAWMTAVLAVVADRASDLSGFDIAAERCACADADAAVKGDAVFHQNVADTCGVHPAHGAAFENEAGF